MPDRRYVYRVELDQGSARQSASQLRQIYEREMSRIQVRSQALPGGGAGGVAGGTGAGATWGGVGRALMNPAGLAIGGFAVGALASQAGQMALELDRQAVAYRRVSVAAVELAGSQGRVNSLMDAYQQATGGAVDKATAMADVTKLMALGFADSEQELTRFVQAARGAALATGGSVDYIVGQLQLAIANQSTMRLDQLGLGVSETKARIAELKETMDGATDEMVYQEAILGLLNEKYGGLVRSAEAAASGQELFAVGVKNARLELAEMINLGIDDWLVQFAVRAFDVEAPLSQLAEQMERLREESTGNQWVPDWLGGDIYDRDIEGTSMLIDLHERLNAAVDDGANVIPGYQAAIAALMSQIITEGRVTVEIMAEIVRIVGIFDAMVGGFGPVTGPITQEQWAANQPEPTKFGPVGWGGPVKFSRDGGIDTSGMSKEFALMREDIQTEQRQASEKAARESAAAQRKAASEAERAWKEAAAETERAFKESAQNFANKLQGIPGLFGASDVTGDQMNMASLGIPQDFADNYLRRLTDEVLNGKDWDNVDIGDAARRAGIDASLDPKAILAMFTDMWKDSSLFANPENLDLLDRDAIRAGLKRATDAESGRANIMAMFGLTPDGEYKEAEEMGRILGIKVAGGAVSVMPDETTKIVGTVQTGLTNEGAIKQYTEAGATIANDLYTAFATRAGELDWAGAILGRLYSGMAEAIGPEGGE